MVFYYSLSVGSVILQILIFFRSYLKVTFDIRNIIQRLIGGPAVELELSKILLHYGAETIIHS